LVLEGQALHLPVPLQEQTEVTLPLVLLLHLAAVVARLVQLAPVMEDQEAALEGRKPQEAREPLVKEMMAALDQPRLVGVAAAVQVKLETLTAFVMVVTVLNGRLDQGLITQAAVVEVLNHLLLGHWLPVVTEVVEPETVETELLPQQEPQILEGAVVVVETPGVRVDQVL